MKIEDALKEKLQKIFGIAKITFDDPGPAHEQECIFVEITEVQERFKDGRELAKVIGNAIIFGNNDKLSFGFISRQIAKAKPADTKPFFFSEFESNKNQYRNIVQRGLSFIYFFDSQYDPNLGTMNGVEFTIEET